MKKSWIKKYKELTNAIDNSDLLLERVGFFEEDSDDPCFYETIRDRKESKIWQGMQSRGAIFYHNFSDKKWKKFLNKMHKIADKLELRLQEKSINGNLVFLFEPANSDLSEINSDNPELMEEFIKRTILFNWIIYEKLTDKKYNLKEFDAEIYKLEEALMGVMFIQNKGLPKNESLEIVEKFSILEKNNFDFCVKTYMIDTYKELMELLISMNLPNLKKITKRSSEKENSDMIWYDLEVEPLSYDNESYLVLDAYELQEKFFDFIDKLDTLNINNCRLSAIFEIFTNDGGSVAPEIINPDLLKDSRYIFLKF